MEPKEILPAINPTKIPRVVHKELNVPVIAIPPTPKPKLLSVHLLPAGKAPKTRIPIGYTRPILSVPQHVDRAHLG